jgi:hypothetical protein
MDEQDERVVYVFPKNSREEVRAALTTYKDLHLADIRVWATDDDGDGDHRTRKGLAIQVRDLPKLLEAVQALMEARPAA